MDIMDLTINETRSSKIRDAISCAASLLDFYKNRIPHPYDAPTPQGLQISRKVIWKVLTCDSKQKCAFRSSKPSCRFCRSFVETESYDDFIKRIYPSGINANYNDD